MRRLLQKILPPFSIHQHPPARRFLHHSLTPPTVPPPTKTIPDVTAFLTAIGRETASHAPKFQSWEQFFLATSAQLKALGIEPPRTRRYIVRWREKFRVFNGKVALVEHKRGRKIDGGQRRRKEVRAKRFAEERKKEEGRER